MARTGRVVQVIGPVIDVEFTGGLPAIYNAVRIVSEAKPGVEAIDVVAEVEQHLGENRVRTVAMKPTDGMTRGMEVIDTGAPITVPVGPETLGRILNVIGLPVDELKNYTAWKDRMLARPAVRRVLEREQNVLVTA